MPTSMPTSPPRRFRLRLSRAALFACCLGLAHAEAAFGQASRPALTPPPSPITNDAAVPRTQLAPLPDVADGRDDSRSGPTAGQPGHKKPEHGKPGQSKEVVYYHDATEVIGPLEGMCLTIKSRILQMQAQPKYLDDYLRCLRDRIFPWCAPECEYPADPYGVYGYGYGGNAFVPADYTPPAGYGQNGHPSPYGRVYDPLTGRMYPPGYGQPGMPYAPAGGNGGAAPYQLAPAPAAVPPGDPAAGFRPGAGGYPPAGGRPSETQTAINARINLPSMGGNSIAYPTNPNYFDPRDGRIYAAQGYGQPVAQPLAPNVGMTYNYSHGFPGSRLTPVSRMPGQQP